MMSNAFLPVMIGGAYFFVGLVLYTIRNAVHGRHHDAEVESRGSSAIIGMWARNYFAWVTQPIWALLVWTGVPPNAITMLSVLLAAAAGVAVASGRFTIGGWLYLFAGVCDFLDGRLARSTGRASTAGAALDSVLDRYAESAMLLGLGWFYRDSWVLLAVMATLVGSALVPYVRARGEGLGVDVKVGLMQRPERLVLLGAAVTFSPVLTAFRGAGTATAPPFLLTVLVLCLLGVATQITAIRRLVHVVNALAPATAAPARIKPAIPLTLFGLGVEALAVLGLAMVLDLPAWLATALGCLVGIAIVRYRERDPRVAFDGISSAILNGGGIAVLLFLPGLALPLAWLITRTAVYIGWSYPLGRAAPIANTPVGYEDVPSMS